MIRRIITAILLAPVFLALLILGDIYFGFLVLALALAGINEFNSLIIRSGYKAFIKVNFLSVSFLALLTILTGAIDYATFSLLLLFMLYATLPLFFFQNIGFKETALNFWGVVYTGGLFISLAAIRFLPQGLYLTLLLVLGVWAGDIAAYFTGLKFGRHRLTIVSPNKTWEGAIGGFFATILSVSLLNIMLTSFPFVKILPVGIIIALFSQIGDLSQSALKREVGVKDSGSLLPGHGGILDRFDGLLFAAPAFYAYYLLLL